ncbi:MAG: hypothetical protein AAFY71_08535 [Bacteroidota bacterium]
MDESLALTIDQYLNGELSAAEREAFELLIASDPVVAQEVSLQREIAAAFQEAEVEDLEQKLAEIMRPEGKVRVLKINRRIWAVAASVVLILGMGYLLFRNRPTSRTPQELYLAYADLPTDLQMESDVRSGQTGQESDFRPKIWMEVDSLYQTKQYGLAKEKLQIWLVQNPEPKANQAAIYYYYLGLLQLQMSQFPAAQNSFSRVRSGPYAESANWYLKLAELRTKGTTSEVKKGFEQFLRFENPYREKAKAILDAWPEV